MTDTLVPLQAPAERSKKPTAGELRALTDGLAEILMQHLAERDEALGRQDRPGSAKQITTLTLALELSRGVRREIALAHAARAVAARVDITHGGLKRSTSEARALLGYGLEPGWEGALPAEAARSDPALLAGLDELMRPISITLAVSARADELSGAKGGRPRKTREDPAELAELLPVKDADAVEYIQRLIRLDRKGNRDARSQLVAIDTELRSWLHQQVVRPSGRYN
jgi:hypothetical protein